MRRADDQWDIASSVGWTALMVAAGRAVETHRADGLVDDPYAEDFVARAHTPQPLPTRPEQRWPDAERVGDERTVIDELWSVTCTYQGIRSRFFDTVLATAAGDGVDQVVLLAAGLDARALRLGSVVDRFRDDPAVARFGSPFGVDMSSLVFVEERDGPSPADRLGRDAWSVRVHTPLELAERYRRALPALSTGTELDSQLITARR
jgi:hypothetical protein